MKKLEEYVFSIPDFPKAGILFRDVTGILASGEGFRLAVDAFCRRLEGVDFDLVVSMESRGFLFGAPVACRLGKGFVPIRKPGKLPCDTVQESYAKEYGKDTIEIHRDAIDENDVILLHDDLLATGGTMKAACNLVKKFHPNKVYCNFIIELVNEGLNGRDSFDEDIEITSLIKI